MSNRVERPDDASYEEIDDFCAEALREIVEGGVFEACAVIGEIKALDAVVNALRELHTNTSKKYHGPIPTGLLNG